VALHLRTLLLALCCLAALPAGTLRAPHPAPAPASAEQPDVLRAGDDVPQPFVARAGALLEGLTGSALGGTATRQLHGSRHRTPQPAPGTRLDTLRHLRFAVTLRRARLAGLARFGGTPPPRTHA
jgi:hypothetical protein